MEQIVQLAKAAAISSLGHAFISRLTLLASVTEAIGLWQNLKEKIFSQKIIDFIDGFFEAEKQFVSSC